MHTPVSGRDQSFGQAFFLHALTQIAYFSLLIQNTAEVICYLQIKLFGSKHWSRPEVSERQRFFSILFFFASALFYFTGAPHHSISDWCQLPDPSTAKLHLGWSAGGINMPCRYLWWAFLFSNRFKEQMAKNMSCKHCT